MARPYSIDLRERVVSAVLAGESCRAVAARFGVAEPAGETNKPKAMRGQEVVAL